MAVSLAGGRRLTQQQKYNRGLLPQLTSVADTRIRYPIRRPSGGGGGAAMVAQSAAPKATSLNPQAGWAQNYGGPLRVNLGGDLANWGGMIGGDYGVQEMESMMNARMGRARGDFQSQMRQALIDLGITDRSKMGAFSSYIDDDTISKAAENKYSRVAQTQQREVAQRAQSEADLAARGLLSSGQLTTNAENILAEGEQTRYGALRDFLGAGQQGLGQIADMQDQYAMQLAQARADAAARAAETYWMQQALNPPTSAYIQGVTDTSGLNPGDVGYQAPGLWQPGYEGSGVGGGAGVQDLINQGVLDYEGLKNLGYKPPPWYTG